MSFVKTGEILDGKKVSQDLLLALSGQLAELKAQQHVLPKLVVILVGENPASHVYVKKKARVAQQIGMLSEVFAYPHDVDKATLLQDIRKLNNDETVHGILVQLPLPAHLDANEILLTVHPDKDVDGLHPLNLGKLMMGYSGVAKPCTPAGVIELLKAYQVPFEGRHAVVVGRSNIVGKPMGMLLLEEHASVSYCHSRTRNRREITRQADILIVAAGVPNLITGEDIAPGAVVVDVGINRVEGALVGDVDFASAAEKASYITPVPGGVGPMTIAMLMSNTVSLYRSATGA